ncbi:unnamed protein product [Acanthocheilonema viteae]|uniref:BLOC-1-related complex subunit 5 n=1 Tax=Acanthocheilonema viteae TaxID=6277 RepID=A0A498S6B7_ACAVI|nr:unnamed protein product [Acanthocheilonema viteae]
MYDKVVLCPNQISQNQLLQLNEESIEIPREHLPDPETENLPSSVSFRQESTAELEKHWTDTGIDRIHLNRPRPPRAKTKGKVIVVKQRTNAAGPSCTRDDEVIKRFLQIPKFYPILKSSLNQPGLRDPPETILKINALPILKFAYRLQEHLSRCANTVVMEQESLGNSMKDMDRDIALLLLQFNDRKRSMDRFQNYLEKISDLQAHVSNLRQSYSLDDLLNAMSLEVLRSARSVHVAFLFQDLMSAVETLNEILPEQKRLPALDIDYLVNGTRSSLDGKHNKIIREIESNTCSVDSNQDDLHIKPVDEVAVVDKNNT